MQTTFTVNRKQIISALNNKPIGAKAGTFSSTKPTARTVRFSATGAVLAGLADTSKRAAKALNEMQRGEFHSAAYKTIASIESFERLETEYVALRVARVPAEKARKALVNWVRESLPPSYKCQVELTA